MQSDVNEEVHSNSDTESDANQDSDIEKSNQEEEENNDEESASNDLPVLSAGAADPPLDKVELLRDEAFPTPEVENLKKKRCLLLDKEVHTEAVNELISVGEDKNTEAVKEHTKKPHSFIFLNELFYLLSCLQKFSLLYPFHFSA